MRSLVLLLVGIVSLASLHEAVAAPRRTRAQAASAKVKRKPPLLSRKNRNAVRRYFEDRGESVHGLRVSHAGTLSDGTVHVLTRRGGSGYPVHQALSITTGGIVWELAPHQRPGRDPALSNFLHRYDTSPAFRDRFHLNTIEEGLRRREMGLDF